MKKKIFLFIPTIGNGGAEKMVIDLAAGIDKTKYDVVLFSLYGKEKADIGRIRYAKSSGVDVQYLGKKSGFDIRLLLKMAYIIMREKPDILHSHIESFQYVVLLGRVFNLRHIHTMHSIGGNEPAIYRFLLKHAYKNRQFFMVALSKSIHEILVQRFPHLNNRIITIYNGVDKEHFASQKSEQNKELLEFICVANLTPVKNHQMLIQSFSEAKQRGIKAHLSLVGDGPNRKILEKMINDLNMNQYITLFGNVEDPSVLLKKSDVFVLASHFEGMPLSVAEAMSAGLPIIAPNVGGLPEMIQENGILFCPDNQKELTEAILTIAQTPEAWKNYHDVSIVRSAAFDKKVMVEKYEELYR